MFPCTLDSHYNKSEGRFSIRAPCCPLVGSTASPFFVLACAAASTFHACKGTSASIWKDDALSLRGAPSLPTPRRKSSLKPLRIRAQLGRDPSRPNSKTLTTEVRVPKAQTMDDDDLEAINSQHSLVSTTSEYRWARAQKRLNTRATWDQITNS